MPQADPASVRVAAAQASAVSNELQRIKLQLTGAAAGGGWTGAARLAFDAEMADRIKQFDPVIARYDGYAASLVSYARALEQTLPPLQQAHRRLVTASSNRQSSPDGTDPPADLNQEFDRLWRDWDGARRTCMSALEQAARNAADRHGLSALWHSATHLAHEVVNHVNLAEISKALSELGDVLFVAALVLSPVPGVGELLWTAVTIVAVAKLAVDGARMASGDKSVTPSDLGWDAVGALAGGKSAKAAKEALKGSKFVKDAKEAKKLVEFEAPNEIESLAADATKVDLVPGGGLTAHEAPHSSIGHTLRKHVGKTYEYLVSRFKQSHVPSSSSFYDRATAEHVMSDAMSQSDKHIERWLASPAKRMRITARCKDPVGTTVARSDRIEVHTKFFLINLEKDSSMKLGYYIPTSHPIPIPPSKTP